MSPGIVDVAIPLVTFLLMVVVGLDLTASEFHRRVERPQVMILR